jgi:hypothetical protein
MIEASVQVASVPDVHSNRRRTDRSAGLALEILGHAIEYLTDEYVHEGGSLSAQDDHVQAIQLLMSLNRQIYYACPVVPTFAERCLGILRPSSKSDR